QRVLVPELQRWDQELGGRRDLADDRAPRHRPELDRLVADRVEVAVQRRDAAQVRGDRPDRLAELLAHPADLARAAVELLLAYQHGHGRADHEPEQRDHEHQLGECETTRALHGHSRSLLYTLTVAPRLVLSVTSRYRAAVLALLGVVTVHFSAIPRVLALPPASPDVVQPKARSCSKRDCAMVATRVCSRAPPIVRTTIEDVAPRLRIPTVK